MGTKGSVEGYTPRPATIKRLCKAIRATWTEEERLLRARGVTLGIGDPPSQSPRVISAAEVLGRPGGIKAG